jgi:hypothetical protein
MTKDEALKLALERVANALPAYIEGTPAREYLAVIHSALAAPVHEPVATLWQHGETGRTRITMSGDITDCDARWFKASDLYTTPPAATDLQAELDATNRQVEILSDALSESQREVAALKAVQEPVAVMELYASGWDLIESVDLDWLQTLPFGTKLYTTPPAAQPAPPECQTEAEKTAFAFGWWKALESVRQPAVPDAFGTREGEHPQYIQGWNDCRAEMLKGMKP